MCGSASKLTVKGLIVCVICPNSEPLKYVPLVGRREEANTRLQFHTRKLGNVLSDKSLSPIETKLLQMLQLLTKISCSAQNMAALHTFP